MRPGLVPSFVDTNFHGEARGMGYKIKESRHWRERGLKNRQFGFAGKRQEPE